MGKSRSNTMNKIHHTNFFEKSFKVTKKTPHNHLYDFKADRGRQSKIFSDKFSVFLLKL